MKASFGVKTAPKYHVLVGTAFAQVDLHAGEILMEISIGFMITQLCIRQTKTVTHINKFHLTRNALSRFQDFVIQNPNFSEFRTRNPTRFPLATAFLLLYSRHKGVATSRLALLNVAEKEI